MSIWSPLVRGITTYLGVTPPKPEHEKHYVLGLAAAVALLALALTLFGYFLLTSIVSSNLGR